MFSIMGGFERECCAGTLHKDAKFNPLRSIIEGYANNSFVVRQEEREYVLPLGTQITAVGQVSLSPHLPSCSYNLPVSAWKIPYLS